MKYLYYPIIAILIILFSIEFFDTIVYAVTHLAKYQWMIYGMIAYFIIRRFRFFSCNEEWLQTTSHELSHTIVGLMFLHKIHSLESRENSGVVYHSGKYGGIFISLAPYCLPIFTYIILLARLIGANQMLYIFDILIGFSLAFHILCFWTQTRLYQPDIKNQGIIRSLLFIVAFWFFNATIILLSIRKGFWWALTYIFPQYWKDIVSFWNFIF